MVIDGGVTLLISPLIVGTVITRAIYGVYVLTRRLTAGRRRHE